MKKSHLFGTVSACVLVLITTTTNAALLSLESRLGGLAYYDPNLNITWTAQSNINSWMSWDQATTWAAGLTIDGVGGWRLASMDVNNDGNVESCNSGSNPACTDNEYGYLFWNEGFTSLNPGPLDIQQGTYWSSTALASNFAWVFAFGDGSQSSTHGCTNNCFAWAVHDGDVGAVPIPAAVWLFGSGLLGLMGISRRKHSNV